MRYQLEPTLRIGPRQIAVISCIQVRRHQIGCTYLFQGGKSPEYILVKDGDDIEAFNTSGTRIGLEDIKSECRAAAISAFEN